jgi:hypothetical protein
VSPTIFTLEFRKNTLEDSDKSFYISNYGQLA